MKKPITRLTQSHNARRAALDSFTGAFPLRAPAEPPNRLQVGYSPAAYCNAYDVYFNGVKQTLCTVADVKRGYITRYIKGKGRTGIGHDMETLFGEVKIVLRGVKLEQQTTSEGTVHGAGAISDRTASGEGSAIGSGDPETTA